MAKHPLSILPDNEQGQPSAPFQSKPWFDAVLESPVFAGVLALIALAIGFSPRASTLGTWVCLALAWLLLARMVYMLDHVRVKTRGSRWKITGVIGAASLITFTAFGLWLMQPLKSAIAAQVASDVPLTPRATPTPIVLPTSSQAERRVASLKSPSPATSNTPPPVTVSPAPIYTSPVITVPWTGVINDDRSVTFPSLSIPSPLPGSAFIGLGDIGIIHCEVSNSVLDVTRVSGPLLTMTSLPVYISGATIRARNLETNKEYTGITDIIGNAVLLVPYGSYDLTVTASGYSQVIPTLRMAVEVKIGGLNYITLYMRKIETATPTPKQ